MKKNTIALWAFVAVVAVIAIASAPGVSDRINGWLGKGPAPEMTDAEKAAGTQQAATPEKPAEPAAPGATVSETGPKPTAGTAPAADAQPAAEPKEGTKQATAGEVTIPTFDVVRVEPDGSTLIAGRAGADATVEVLSGADTIAEAKAEANGDFVAVLTEPLAPGTYELVLRSTEKDGVVAMSTQTAIISVPEKGHEGELLALVEEPGEASRLINTPKPEAMPADQPSGTAMATSTPAEPGAPQADTQAQGGETAVATAPAAQSATDIRIEAVEIDGDTVFVAGTAPAGSQVRVYANEILLGDTSAGPGGRFLVEVKIDLPVGDYIIRADLIDPATGGVSARAAVPFTRSEGEHLAAVATQPEASSGAGAGTDSAAVVVPEPSTALPGSPPAVPGEVTITGQLKRTDSSVIIRRGDTLWHISRRIYGQGVRYTTIYLANQKQIKDPDMIWPGQVFALPEKSAN